MPADLHTTTADRIEKRIELRATRSRVWRALTNVEEFGAWFRVKLDGAFAEGAVVRGKLTYPGYEQVTLEIAVDRMEPERLFSYRWHPNPSEGVDYSSEPTTLVEFRLADANGGTLLTLVESGFYRLPASRRAEAFRRNEGGWQIQLENVQRHVEG